MKKYKDMVMERDASAAGEEALADIVAKELSGSKFQVAGADVQAFGDRVKVRNAYYYEREDDEFVNARIADWSPGGYMYKHFKSKFGITTKVAKHKDDIKRKYMQYMEKTHDGVLHLEIDLA